MTDQQAPTGWTPAAAPIQQKFVAPQLNDAARLGSALAAMGVDPATSSQIVQHVEAIVGGAVMEAVSAVITATYQAQQVRAAALAAAVQGLPNWPWTAKREELAQAAGNPSLLPVAVPVSGNGTRPY
jgi:hypothetical protein